MADGTARLVTEQLPFDGGRSVTVYVPRRPVDDVVFAADGGWHVDRLARALERADVTSTMIVGVHGQPDDEGRLAEYVVGRDTQRFETHERFFVHDVRAWLGSRFEVARPAARTAVWGASLGAEFALAMGLRRPDVYGTALCASPGAGFPPPPTLPRPLPRVRLAAGRGEPFFLANAERWADALAAAGADVALTRYDGDHGGAFWYDAFPSMLARIR